MSYPSPFHAAIPFQTPKLTFRLFPVLSLPYSRIFLLPFYSLEARNPDVLMSYYIVHAGASCVNLAKLIFISIVSRFEVKVKCRFLLNQDYMIRVVEYFELEMFNYSKHCLLCKSETVRQNSVAYHADSGIA